MKCLLSCSRNMDTACVELKFLDGSMIAYTDLILNGNTEAYRKTVTEYKSLD
jgi:hypothetical protein